MKHLTKVIAVIVLIVLALSLCACSEARTERENQEKIDEAQRKVDKYGGEFWGYVDSNIKPVDPACVYYVPNGKSFHSTASCVALHRSQTILHGELTYVIAAGKGNPCSKCVGDNYEGKD